MVKPTYLRQGPAISMLAENETGARVCDLTRGSIAVAGLVLSTITRKWFPNAHQQKLTPSLNIPPSGAHSSGRNTRKGRGPSKCSERNLCGNRSDITRVERMRRTQLFLRAARPVARVPISGPGIRSCVSDDVLLQCAPRLSTGR